MTIYRIIDSKGRVLARDGKHYVNTPTRSGGTVEFADGAQAKAALPAGCTIQRVGISR